MSKMKRCSRCRRKLSLSEFYKDKSRKGGLRYQCRECDAKRGKEYRKSPKSKQAIKRRKQRWPLHPMSVRFPPSTKVCKGCDQLKLFEEFNKCSANKDGLRSQCKDCRLK